jgi:hypothetical protein
MKIIQTFSKLEKVEIELTENDLRDAVRDYLDKNPYVNKEGMEIKIEFWEHEDKNETTSIVCGVTLTRVTEKVEVPQGQP